MCKVIKMEEKVNYSELREYAVKQRKSLKGWERSVEVLDVVIEADRIISAIRDEEKTIKTNILRDGAVLEGLRIELGSLREEIQVCNNEITGKVKKTKEELEYYQVELSGVKAMIEGVKNEAQILGKQVTDKKKELGTVSGEIEKKNKDYVDIQGKANTAKSNLKAIKDSLHV